MSLLKMLHSLKGDTKSEMATGTYHIVRPRSGSTHFAESGSGSRLLLNPDPIQSNPFKGHTQNVQYSTVHVQWRSLQPKRKLFKKEISLFCLVFGDNFGLLGSGSGSSSNPDPKQ
jgi:hypothetical protein